MLQALIFDMDGTLFQTDKILELSLDDTFNHLRSLQLWDTVTPIDKYREIMGVPLPKVWEALLPDHSLEIREQTDAYFLERLIENIKSGKGALYPNVKEIFTYIKENNCSIHIASNGLTEYLRAIVSYCQQRFKFPQFQRNEIPHYERLNRCLGRINSCFFLFSQTVGVTLDVKCNRMM
ncbi:HAD hydrolase-like protein [Bacillus paranthracis]|nr:HAD hydrolase-like protein [Bacillus paranthracis]